MRRKITPAGNIIFSFHLLISLLPAKHPGSPGSGSPGSAVARTLQLHPGPPPPPQTGKPDFLKGKSKETSSGERNSVCVSREAQGGQGSPPPLPAQYWEWGPVLEEEASLCLRAERQRLEILVPRPRHCGVVCSVHRALGEGRCQASPGQPRPAQAVDPRNGEGEGLIGRFIRETSVSSRRESGLNPVGPALAPTVVAHSSLHSSPEIHRCIRGNIIMCLEN